MKKNEILTPKVGLFFINLCNFASQQPARYAPVETVCTPSLQYMLKNMHLFDEEDYARQEGIFRKLMDECRMDNLTTSEMKEYKKSILDYEDMKKSLAYVDELAYNRGIAEGEAKGKAQGIAEGEAKERLTLAKTMLLKGIDIAMVMSTTGLSEEEIKA